MIPDVTNYTATLGATGHRSPVARRRLRVLDLCCGGGGSARGYDEALRALGYEPDITGVDTYPQPHYPYAFRIGDALTWPLEDYDLLTGSPTCKGFTTLNAIHHREYADLLTPMRKRFLQTGKPWIIENVTRAPFQHGVVLCGSMFGLRVLRHRVFESSHLLYPPGPCHHIGTTRDGSYITVAGHGNTDKKQMKVTQADRRAAMGIDWMNRDELSQAIPPAYTHWLGMQIARVLEVQP